MIKYEHIPSEHSRNDYVGQYLRVKHPIPTKNNSVSYRRTSDNDFENCFFINLVHAINEVFESQGLGSSYMPTPLMRDYMTYVEAAKNNSDWLEYKIWHLNASLCDHRYFGDRATLLAGEHALYLSENFVKFPFSSINKHIAHHSDNLVGVSFSRFLTKNGNIVVYASHPQDNFLCRYFRTVTYENA